MSRIQNYKSKLIVAFAAVGLLVGLSVPKAHAQLSNANYKGRYACGAESDLSSGFSSTPSVIYKYGPNGAGAYNPGGVLVAADAAFASVTTPGTGDFCIYALNPAASSYSIGSDGFGFEKLSWAAASTNGSTCPSDFEDSTAIGIRTDLNADGSTIRADFADADLLGNTETGYGTCLK